MNMSEDLHALQKAVTPFPAPQRDIFHLSNQLLAEGPQVQKSIAAAVVVTVLAIGGFGVWAGTAPLASGAVASGVVRVDTNRKTVQHLEGGIIREVLVREGESVREGQVLVRMEAVAADADREVVQNQIDVALAEEARLVAEREAAGHVAFPTRLREQLHRPEIAALLAAQEQILSSQRAALDGELSVLRQRIEQQRAFIEASSRQGLYLERQIELFREELQTAEELLEKGYERKPRVLGLQRNVAAVEGERISLQGRIDAAHKLINESEAQSEALRRQRANALEGELAKARARSSEAQEMLRKASDRLSRLEVTAPQEGIVLGLKYFAPGAVVPPGGAILDLVPSKETMVLQVRINPLDINVVREGLEAEVRLVALKQRTTPTLTGHVNQVSADAMSDEKGQNSYYQARIDVSADQLARIPGVKLTPGMPIEAVILTGERTLLQYLVRPIVDSFAHAFKEQ